MHEIVDEHRVSLDPGGMAGSFADHLLELLDLKGAIVVGCFGVRHSGIVVGADSGTCHTGKDGNGKLAQRLCPGVCRARCAFDQRGRYLPVLLLRASPWGVE